MGKSCASCFISASSTGSCVFVPRRQFQPGDVQPRGGAVRFPPQDLFAGGKDGGVVLETVGGGYQLVQFHAGEVGKRLCFQFRVARRMVQVIPMRLFPMRLRGCAPFGIELLGKPRFKLAEQFGGGAGLDGHRRYKLLPQRAHAIHCRGVGAGIAGFFLHHAVDKFLLVALAREEFSKARIGGFKADIGRGLGAFPLVAPVLQAKLVAAHRDGAQRGGGVFRARQFGREGIRFILALARQGEAVGAENADEP